MRERARSIVVCLAAGAGLLILTGCYTRTIESKGLGAKYGGGDYYQPSVKQGKGEGVLNGMGDVLFGVDEPRKQR